MAVGTAWAAGDWILLAAVSIVFAFVYHFIILDEETKLKKIFGPSYELYVQYVPRFFPRLYPAPHAKLLEINPEPAHHLFSHQLAHANKAFEAYLSFAGLIAGVWVFSLVWNLYSYSV